VLDGREDVEAVEVEDGEDVEGAAVDAKESVKLPTAQNCWASFSAEGTSALQLAATQL